jgi:hypothetical protein
MFFLNILNNNPYINIKISKKEVGYIKRKFETLYKKKISEEVCMEKKGDLSNDPWEVLS